MIGKHTELRVNVNSYLSPKEKEALAHELKIAHGVKSVRINDMPQNTLSAKSVQKISSQNDVNLSYEKYLDRGTYDESLFNDIDAQVCSLMGNNIEEQKSRYEIIYIKGKNVLSYSEFEFDMTGLEGISVISSEPQNFGGKTNLFRLFQILLWGTYQIIDTKSTIDNIPNYLVQKNAHIEGTIKIDDKLFFVRRDYYKKRTSYEHKFQLFELCDQTIADCFIETAANVFDVVPLNAVDGTMDGFYAKNLNTKGTAALKEYFIDNVGTIEDFLGNCYFDQLNINRLLQEKPAARTRDFYNLFGGQLFEQKRDIAKDLYKKFRAQSTVHSLNIETLKNEMSELKAQIEKDGEQLSQYTNEINDLEKKIKDVENKREALFNELLSIEDIDIQSIDKSIEQTKASIESLRSQKKALAQKNIEYTEKDILEMKSKVSEIQDKLLNLKDDEELLKRKKLFLNQKENDEQIIKTLEVLDDIQSTKIQIKAEFESLKSKIRDIETVLQNESIAEPCPHCGKDVKNVEQLRAEHVNELNTLQLKKKQLIERSKKLVEKENKQKQIKQSYYSLIEKSINDIEKDIINEKNKRAQVLRNEIEQIQNKISSYNEAVLVENKRVQFSQNIELNENRLSEYKAKKRAYEKSKVDYEHNQKIKLRITSMKEEIENIQHYKKQLSSTYNIVSNDIAKNSAMLDMKKTSLVKLSDEIQMDAAFLHYINAHDKDGIIAKIIASYLDDINTQLKAILSNMHYNVEIRQYKNNIEYYYLTVDDMGKEIEKPLATASNFERFMAISALHLVRLKYSKVNLPNIVFFDEVFAQTGDENLPLLYSALENFKDIFNNIFVISHKQKVQALGDNTIMIKKEKTGSKILY